MMNRAAVLASLLLAPALASADDLAPPSAQPPVPQPAAQPAPQNEDWSNVSHINGQLVKVGERNDYLYNYKRVNIAIDPIGPFYGYYDGSISYGLTQNIAISASFSAWNESGGNNTGYQATVSLPVYFRRTYSGPFIEPGLIMRSTTNNEGSYYACDGCDATATSSTDTWAGPELLLGWHWTFDSGLNMVWAAGVAKHATDSGDSMTTSDSPDVNAYFRVGYAF
ncbi:MAG TPA: hypothetical protein VMJ10_01985 [Kofleriaceae bacterium]|nr:hypothetical protein [Kofleriaceae bacterium]